MKKRRSGHDKKRTFQPQRRPLRLPLPDSTIEVIERHIDACHNPGLIYERYVKYLHRGDDWSLTPTTGAREENPKQKALAATIAAQNRVSDLVQLWQAIQTRWECVTGKALTFLANPTWRFVSGLGRGGPLEVGFTFHRIYGFPIIPGSSLKGLARMKALVELSKRLSKPFKDLNWLDTPREADFEQKLAECAPAPDVETQQQARWFRLIFGTTKQAGAAVFFDAIPVNPPQLEHDVMTPHFSKYYQDNGSPPADWDEPKPVPFLTVGKGTNFCFAVGWRGNQDEEAHQQARRWLQKGLQNLGVGAKTAAGYGYFANFGADYTIRSKLKLAKSWLSEDVLSISSKDPEQQVVNNFIRGLKTLPVKDVAGQIARFVDRWRQAQLPDEYRVQMAQAILEKVEAAGRTKKSRQKKWFQELQTFLTEHGSSEG